MGNVVYILNFAILGTIFIMNMVVVRRIVREHQTRTIQQDVAELQEEIEKPIRERAQQTVEKEDRWELEYE